MKNMFKIYDEPESPNRGGCVFKIYDKPESPMKGRLVEI